MIGTRNLSCLFGMALLALSAGCAPLSSPVTPRERTAALGALAGGAGGAIIGSMTGSALAGGLFGMPLGALGGYYIGDQLASNQRATEIQLRERDMEIQRLRRENERLRREEDLPERGARLSRSEVEPERQTRAAPERQARVDPAQSEPQGMTASRQAVSATPGQVRQVQRKLNETGYNSGSVDGIWGPRTEAAVRSFQRAKGLQVTGRLNEQTLQALGVDEAGQSAQTSGEAQETRSEEPSQKNRQNP